MACSHLIWIESELRNPWSVCKFVLCALRYARSMDCRAKYGSMICAAQYMDCTNSYFVPNIYSLLLQLVARHSSYVPLQKAVESSRSFLW